MIDEGEVGCDSEEGADEQIVQNNCQVFEPFQHLFGIYGSTIIFIVMWGKKGDIEKREEKEKQVLGDLPAS